MGRTNIVLDDRLVREGLRRRQTFATTRPMRAVT